MSDGHTSWMAIDMRHLAALKAVAEHRSFSRAGDSLGYSQSSISQQIAALERTVGQRLVDRSRGSGVRMTDAGEVVLLHIEAILAQLSAARREVDAILENRSDELRVGLTQSIGVRVFPELICRFRAERPDIRLRPTESPGDLALYQAIEDGQVELAFVDLPPPAGPFELFELLVDPYVLIVRRDSPFANREPKLQQLADIPLIGHSCCRGLEHVESLLRASGIEPTIGFRSDINATIQALVAAGLGVAILTALAADSNDPLTTTCELPEIPPRIVALARHRDRPHTEAACAFLEAAQAMCGGPKPEGRVAVAKDASPPPTARPAGVPHA
jgi:DNA-binding transcriptional LysR family regulator